MSQPTPSIPTLPVVNQPNRYVQGGQLSYSSNSVVNIAVGQMRNVTNQNDIIWTSQLSPSLTSSGANGLDTGTVAANTLYAVFVIGCSTNQGSTANPANPNYPLTAGLFSLSPSAPVLPFGYDMFRRVGYVLTDGSSHILKFQQEGADKDRTMWYDALISVLSAGSQSSYTAVSLASCVPPVATTVIFTATVTPTAAGNSATLVPGGSTATGGYAQLSGAVASVAQIAQLEFPCGVVASAPSISYKVTGTLSLSVNAYVDSI